jgi:hypothetical protein
MLEQNNAEQSQPVETQPELVNTTPAEDPVTTHERAMFNKYVQDQGQKIPSNFKDADAWFNSLLEARKGFTQARQEVAALKKQYNENGVSNPAYQPSGVVDQVQEEPKSEDLSGIPEDLKITMQDASKPPINSRISTEDWAKWGKEIDSTGSVSATTRKEIKDKMGADDVIIEQMIRGRKALAKQSWDDAASVVGGGDNLKRLFKWAQTNLSKEEVDATNRALQTNAYRNVLLGLKARFESETTPAKPASKEPQALQNRVNPSQVPQQVQVFKNMAEQKAAVADPRYRTDANFRRAVEQMLINTSRYGFRNR